MELLIDVQFSTNEKLATTQDHQTLQNSDDKQYLQYWILRLVVFTRFPANRDCLLKFYISGSQSGRWETLGGRWSRNGRLGAIGNQV